MNKEEIIKRIKINEEKLDNIKLVVNHLEISINEFENIQETIKEINKYYGSKDWFNDKENFEKGLIKDIKAGILSEDDVWNLLEKVKELNNNLNLIVKKIWKD